MISVARYFQWPPHILDSLFLDDYDHNGLAFWFNDCKTQDKKSKEELSKLKSK